MARTVGDESFEAAYRELFARAATLAYRILGEQTAAEDVAAETLARTYAHWRRVSSLPYREGWVLRVATNLAIDATRRRPAVVDAAPTPDAEEAAGALGVSASTACTHVRRGLDALRDYLGDGFREEGFANGRV